MNRTKVRNLKQHTGFMTW